jgi:hypothetical protein
MEAVQLNSLGLQASNRIQTDLIYFAESMLGLPVSFHKGQTLWLQKSIKRINLLRPGNKWGKSLIGAVKHTWHHAVKPLFPKHLTNEEWMSVKYDTLNFGPGYEQAREILRMFRDIIQGNILLPEEIVDKINPTTGKPWGHTNISVFKDWFIVEDRADSNTLPYIKTAFGVNLFGRSYDEMGQAFKMKMLAYVSGDECADIDELWTFTNGTLLPRQSGFRGAQLDFYGTPQPNGLDYVKMIEMAEEDMKRKDWEQEGLWYTQKGSMYENFFLPKETIKQFESIMDPTMREQVIRGEYVETGEKYFGFERIQNAVDSNLICLEYGEPGHKYLTGVDFAGGESQWADYTVIVVVDYTDDRYKLVYFNRFKGGDISIPGQYQLVREVVDKFNSRLIIDSSSLGGKNAMAFLSEIKPIASEFGPTRSGTLKAEMLASLKIAFDGGTHTRYRRLRQGQGTGRPLLDLNDDWGLIKIPNIPVLINELQNYKLADTKIRTDCVFALAMPIHWLELRRPKKQPKRAVEFDMWG